MRGHRIIAFIIAKAQSQIRLDRIQAFILKAVGADLIRQADATALLTQIQQQPFSI